MSTSTMLQLIETARDCQFIRFARQFETWSIRGYVLDVGPEFFLLALVSDRIWFDGFECFRIQDVHDVRPDPYADFAETALRMRGERLPEKPDVSLVDVGELLRSASLAFPLVTIHREEHDSSICHIGRVAVIDDEQVFLQEINPDATWDDEATAYRLDEITRVNFGGDYENALHLVGGDPGEPTSGQ